MTAEIFGAFVIAVGILLVFINILSSHTKKVKILGVLWSVALVCFGTYFFIGLIGTFLGYILVIITFVLEHKL